MKLVAEQRQRVESSDVGEEVPLSGRGIIAGLARKSGAEIGLVGDEPGLDQQPVELVSALIGHSPVGGGVANLGNRRKAPVAHLLQPQRCQRTVEFSLKQDLLLVEVV